MGRVLRAGLTLLEVPVCLALRVPRLVWAGLLGCARALGLAPKWLGAWEQLGLSAATWTDLFLSCLHGLMLAALLLLLLVWRLYRKAQCCSLGRLPRKVGEGGVAGPGVGGQTWDTWPGLGWAGLGRVDLGHRAWAGLGGRGGGQAAWQVSSRQPPAHPLAPSPPGSAGEPRGAEVTGAAEESVLVGGEHASAHLLAPGLPHHLDHLPRLPPAAGRLRAHSPAGPSPGG